MYYLTKKKFFQELLLKIKAADFEKTSI